MPAAHGSGRQGSRAHGECPGVDALERLAAQRGAGDEPPEHDPTVAHVRSCAACAELLEQMRSAEGFLDRFRGPLSRSAEAEGCDPGAPQVVGPGARPVIVEGYTVERLIAFGGQGAVYKARQKSTDRLVAIKVPLADTQRRPSTKYRFEREVELAARLDHPGVVRIIEACRLDDGRLGYVMEFVEGESFDRWAAGVRPDGQAGLRRIVAALADVADAIAYAHLRAVLHRDIKPSNVVVTREGRARILDFGLAKALDGSGSSFTTVTGAFIDRKSVV